MVEDVEHSCESHPEQKVSKLKKDEEERTLIFDIAFQILLQVRELDNLINFFVGQTFAWKFKVTLVRPMLATPPNCGWHSYMEQDNF